jgi:transposase-like protein
MCVGVLKHVRRDANGLGGRDHLTGQWTPEQKAKVLSEALEPGATVSAVADRNGSRRSQLYAWLRLARDGGIPGISLDDPQKPLFVPARIAAAPSLPTQAIAKPGARGGEASSRSDASCALTESGDALPPSCWCTAAL